jgi:hypothetical protein
MDKLKMQTPNLADRNFAALHALFPNAVTETIDENGAVVRAIAQAHPYYAVFRDSSFASDSTLVNFEQIFKTYSPTTVRKVL